MARKNFTLHPSFPLLLLLIEEKRQKEEEKLLKKKVREGKCQGNFHSPRRKTAKSDERRTRWEERRREESAKTNWKNAPRSFFFFCPREISLREEN
jgi:hypothetical protein